jgi:hypothetical protein
MSKQYRSIAEAEKAAQQRIRMIGNKFSRTRKTAYGSTTVEESRLHGNLKDFTAWKRNKLKLVD